ncbi:exo-alpha-sialidase [Ruania alkalisoli]|uniref:Exo-alpha-sialidase n=1 Tax=Ruania alkalisoli TaxID=2779775 RepID=A0A7M1SSM9_9MICO|nr:exo-alpha-sialidase [Ruania alkalisoli]QOR70556.1 exo-alpha-sialidase [Ruania alkalisoli]
MADIARSRRWLVLLAQAIALLLVAAVVAQPAAAEELTDQVTVYSDTSFGDGDGIRTPDVITTSPNNVVVAWREGNTDGQFDNGEVRYSRSTDGGATWTSPAVLAPKDSTYGWHYVILYRVGSDLYAFLGRTPASSYNGMPVTSFMKRSTDGGATWSNWNADFSGVPSGFVIAGRPMYQDGYHIAPFWNDGRVAVMRSTDLVTWTAGAYAPDPLNTKSGENQLVVDQDDPDKLIMFSRVAAPAEDYVTGPVYMSRTESTNGGLTWSSLVYDSSIPNMGTKGYVTQDSTGRYVAVYNTMGGIFPSPLETRPAHWRSILNYKVKEPDQPWGPGRFLADEPPVVDRPHSAGWDTYAMGDEYAPGKYYIVWESDTAGVELIKLDLDQSFTGANENWDTIGNWSVTPAGGSATVSSGRLNLANNDSTWTTVGREQAPLHGFVGAFRGRIATGGPLNTSSGIGANLGMEVVGGDWTLALSAQSDGVYARVAGGSAWVRVLAASIGTGDHQYRVTVDEAGTARLYLDSVDTGVEWSTPASTTSLGIQLFASGTSTEPASASVDWFSVEDNIVSTTWDDLSGWVPFGAGGTVSQGELIVSSPTSGQNAVTAFVNTRCDFSVDFRAEVTDYSTLDPSNGRGASLALMVANDSRRLMLSIQHDGVYAIPKGETHWTRIYALSNAGSLASWRVDTSSGGEARLYRNGVDTGAHWTIQDSDIDPQVRLWSSTNSADTSAFAMDWIRTTCEIR